MCAAKYEPHEVVGFVDDQRWYVEYKGLTAGFASVASDIASRKTGVVLSANEQGHFQPILRDAEEQARAAQSFNAGPDVE